MEVNWMLLFLLYYVPCRNNIAVVDLFILWHGDDEEEEAFPAGCVVSSLCKIGDFGWELFYLTARFFSLIVTRYCAL